MDRREFLKTTGAAAAAATATTAATNAVADPGAGTGLEPASPAVAKGLEELRLTVPWPDAASGPADQAHRLGQRITALSEGRYRIVVATGAGGGLDAVRAGEADLYFASEHDHLHAHRALSYFAGLPGDRGITPRELVNWTLVGGGQALWDDLAADFGVKAMLAGHAGAAIFCARERIDTMNDLQGRKVSVLGLGNDVARGLGLEPVGLPASAVADGLARGDILAAEWGGAITNLALGLRNVAPMAVGTAINRHGTALSLGMSRALWERLSPGDKALFESAAAAELQLSLAEEEAHRRFLAPAPDVNTRWPIAGELARSIRRVADAVVAHVAGSDARAQRINAGYAAFRNSVTRGDEIEGTA